MREQLQAAVKECGKVLLGKRDVIQLAVCCMVGKGHLLLEDLPGVGKTTLAHALAKVFGLQYSRVQFTSDLLPADILGFSLFDAKTGEFEFKSGPIFTQLLLADEVNRATPKTQSALLEAMSEEQVTSDGTTYPLPSPFFVIATQNPERHGGTFSLPEAQLDRFSMRLSIGYPSEEAERAMLNGESATIDSLETLLEPEQIVAIQADVQKLAVSDVCMDYIQRLVSKSRQHEELSLGLSPRGALTLVNCAKAWAYLEGREHVLVDDVQAVFAAVVSHRIRDISNAVPATTELANRLIEQTVALS